MEYTITYNKYSATVTNDNKTYDCNVTIQHSKYIQTVA